MAVVATLDVEGFLLRRDEVDSEAAVRVIEEGGVLVLPRVNFLLQPDEQRFLSPAWSDGRAKNISFDGRALKGARGTPADIAGLQAMVARFAASAASLVVSLFPRYAPWVEQARTSFRPAAGTGRPLSWRKDDSRLHVDAFPSRPTHGVRILRVFANINPAEPRVWRVGPDFEAVARRFLPRIAEPLPGASWLLTALHVTKSRRSEYDHLMLQMHDCMKRDLAWQREVPQRQVAFAPGTTWLCFSDHLPHAVVSGQYMLEQTIHLPVDAMYDPRRSPLAILERLTGRRLVDGPPALARAA